MRKKTWIVTSNKMQKTVTVKVTEYFRHAKYGKDIPTSKKFHARAETPIEEGATVTIEETRPYSKTVTWKVVDQDVIGKN